MKPTRLPAHLIKGRNAERRARRYLENQGLTCVEANYRCRFGEIDLVMRDQSTIVFVEVRYRKNKRYGGALESIDFHKQRKLRASAERYLQRRRVGVDFPCRFDVVLISGFGSDPDADIDDNAQVDWIPNAL
ncbi:MAG: hypothetical protein MAG794_00048 [Gammaproteobacteria bacterium]|nr:hypothetical protein [Gammaproteobacteria bacterium]